MCLLSVAGYKHTEVFLRTIFRKHIRHIKVFIICLRNAFLCAFIQTITFFCVPMVKNIILGYYTIHKKHLMHTIDIIWEQFTGKVTCKCHLQVN